MGSKSTQKTIKIDNGLWNELDIWLKTYGSKRLGYHSKAQFATEAIRKLLVKVEYDKQIHIPPESVKIIKDELIKNKKEMDSLGIFTVKDYLEYTVDQSVSIEREVRQFHKKLNKLIKQKNDKIITGVEFIKKRKKMVNDEIARIEELDIKEEEERKEKWG